MRQIRILEVAFDPAGGVLITPDLPRGEDYNAVYRGAMSVRWDDHASCLRMTARNDRTPVEAFERIVAEVAKEYGDRLVLTQDTRWSNISTPDRDAMIGVAGG